MPLKIPNATMSRVESSFRQLASAAQALNNASEDLSKVIRNLDASLKKLSLGVSAWVPVSGLSDETQYWTVELGYDKVDGKWGLALREINGFHLDNSDESEQVWAYNDAPRTRRAEAVEKIPDLLEKLLQQTQETTRELKERIEQASDFTSVVSELTPNNPPVVPQQWHRPDVSPTTASAGPRRGDREEGSGSKPTPSPFREPQPLPVERPSGERAAAPSSAPSVARFREEDPATPPVGVRPPSARVL